MTGSMLKLLEGLHHQVARPIVGMKKHHTMSGVIEWPSVDDVLETVGLWPINEYIQRRQNKIAEQVACHPIYDMYTGAERMPEFSIIIS